MVSREIEANRISISTLHRKHIRYTKRAEVVTNTTIHLCNLTSIARVKANFNSSKVYLTTRTLKHLYDKRPAQEYDFLLLNIILILRYPDVIYNNKGGKRGSVCFVKTKDDIKYFAAIEQNIDSDENYLVTTFAIDDIYLKGYKEIWRWEGDNLHRNDLDATL